MGKTVKGSKAPGYEYWSRRPNNHGAVGKESKQIIHGQERMIEKELLDEELEEYFDSLEDISCSNLNVED